MARRRRKRSKKWISTLFLFLLLVGAVAVVYFVWDGYFREKAPEQPKGGEETTVVEKPVEQKEEAKLEEDGNKDVVQFDGQNPNTSGEVTGVVTYAGLSGDVLMIRMNIDQYLNGGVCILSLLDDYGNELYGEVVSVVDAASTSTCQGFNVPASGLNGNINIYINVSSNDGKTGTIGGRVSL